MYRAFFTCLYAGFSLLLLSCGGGSGSSGVSSSAVPALVSAANKTLSAQAARMQAWFGAARSGDVVALKAALAQGQDVNAQDVFGATALHWSAWTGKTDAVVYLLTQSPDLEKKTRRKIYDGQGRILPAGSTPFLAAVRQGRLDLSQALFNKGADTAAKDGEGNTALLNAVAFADKQVIDFLLQNGANAKERNQRLDSVLMMAAAQGRPAEISRFLAQGSPATLSNSQGHTVLMFAAEGGNTQAVRQLLAAGANSKAVDNKGWTLPLAAAMGGQLDWFVQWINEGQDEFARSKDGLDAVMAAALGGQLAMLKSLQQREHRLDGRDFSGATPVMMAVLSGDVVTLSFLVDAGADVQSVLSTDVSTPLSVIPAGSSALSLAVDAGRLDMLNVLLEAGARSLATINGESLLHQAARRGSVPVVERLARVPGLSLETGLQQGNQYESLWLAEGSTPLMIALALQDDAMIDALFRVGVNLNARNAQGWFPLMVAAASGNKDAVKALLDTGVSLKQLANNGWNALMAATVGGDTAVVQALITQGVDVTQASNAGKTPLVLAIEQGSGQLVPELLAAGARVNARDDKGWSPLMLAVVLGDTDAVIALLNAGADANVKSTATRQLNTQQLPAGKNALMLAIARSQDTVVNRMLAHGVNLELTDDNGDTAILQAVRQASLKTVQAVLAGKPDLKAHDRDGEGSILVAIRRVDRDVATAVKNAAANFLNQTDTENSVLAVRRTNQDIAVALMDAKAPLNERASDGSGPLLLATKSRLLPLVQGLLKQGVDVDQRIPDTNGLGDTALMLAVDQKDPDLLAAILVNKPGLDLRDKNGDTALIRAVRSGEVPMVDVLLTAGSNADARSERPIPDAHASWVVDFQGNGILITDLFDAALADSQRTGQQTGLSLIFRTDNTDVITRLGDARLNGRINATVDGSKPLDSHTSFIPLNSNNQERMRTFFAVQPEPQLFTNNAFPMAVGIRKNSAALSKVLMDAGINPVSLPSMRILPDVTAQVFWMLPVNSGNKAMLDTVLNVAAQGTQLDAAGVTASSLVMKKNDLVMLAALAQAGIDTTAVVEMRAVGDAALGDVVWSLAIAKTELTAVKGFIGQTPDPALLDAQKRLRLRIAVRQDSLRLWGELLNQQQVVDELAVLGPLLPTSLLLAVNNDDAGMIDALLAGGANPELTDSSGHTALLLSTRLGKSLAFSALIKHSVNLEAEDVLGDTPLLLAAEQGNTPMVTDLVGLGANVSHVNQDGNTAMMLAASADNTGLASVLGTAVGVDVVNKAGDTALLIAVKNGQAAMVDTLLTLQANPALRDVNGDNALMLAIQGNDITIFKAFLGKLLQKAIVFDLEQKNIAGDTALKLAVRVPSVSMVDQLLQAGANANIINAAGDTPLLFAVAENNTALVSLLVGAKVNISLLSAAGDSPLMLAIRNQNAAMTDILFQAGAVVKRVNQAGETPLSLAVANLWFIQTQLFLTAGANPDLGPVAAAPLLGVVQHDRIDFVNLLLQSGANPNVLSASGWTPLMIAASRGNLAIVEALLAASADPRLLNPVRQTARVIAESAGFGSVAMRLQQAGG